MDFKTRHYALRTPDGYLGMDARTKQLEIYEDWQSAVDNCQGCDVVAVEVYDQRQKSVIDEMFETGHDAAPVHRGWLTEGIIRM